MPKSKYTKFVDNMMKEGTDFAAHRAAKATAPSDSDRKKMAKVADLLRKEREKKAAMKNEAMGDAEHKAAVKHITDLGKKHGRTVGQQRMHIDDYPHKYDKKTLAHAKTLNKNQFGGWKVGKDGKTTQKESIEDTLASVETNRRVMKWTDFKEAVAGYDEVTYKDKKRPQDMEIGQSSVRDVKSDKHTKGATPPEGIMDKESPKSKQFYKDHQKSDSKWEDMEDNSHEDASKAMKAGPGPKYRSNDNKSGDRQIINKPTKKF